MISSVRRVSRGITPPMALPPRSDTIDLLHNRHATLAIESNAAISLNAGKPSEFFAFQLFDRIKPHRRPPLAATNHLVVKRRLRKRSNTTASISRPETGHRVHRPRARINEIKALSASHQESESYALTFVHKNMALLKSAQGFYTVRLGTTLPGVGHVLSIERR